MLSAKTKKETELASSLQHFDFRWQSADIPRLSSCQVIGDTADTEAIPKHNAERVEGKTCGLSVWQELKVRSESMA